MGRQGRSAVNQPATQRARLLSIRAFPSLAAALMAALAAGCGTAIHDETAWARVDRVAAMLDADPALLEATNALGKTPLHIAMTSGSPEMIALLINRGANVNAADNTGLTPLHIAAWYTKTATAGQVLDAGADIDARDQFGDTPLHVAAANGRLAMCQFLVERGADPLSRNVRGLTPQDVAEGQRQARAAKLMALLAKRAGFPRPAGAGGNTPRGPGA